MIFAQLINLNIMKTSFLSIRAFLAICVVASAIACSSQRSSEQAIVTQTRSADPVYNEEITPAPSNDGYAPAPTNEGLTSSENVNNTNPDEDMSYAPDRPVASYQTFYDELTPYGRWVDYPGYGYVWSPNVEAGFHPYGTNGHWVYTRYGWTWASNYNWGWAPFHYGRWAYDASYGWLWTPGNVWGPAWVSWRQSNAYYGWAPLGPQVGVNVSLAFGSGYSCPADHYVFVPSHYINSPRVSEYYEDRHRNTTIINNTTIVNNYITNNNNSNNTTVINNRAYVAGPRLDHVQTATGARIQTVNLVESPRSGATVVNNNTVQIYRPRVADPSANTQRQVPASVVRVNNLQPVAQDRRLTPNTPSRPAPQNAPMVFSARSNVRNNNNVQINNSNTNVINTNPVNRNNNYPANRAPQTTDPAYRNRVNNVPLNTPTQTTDPNARNRAYGYPSNTAPQNADPANRNRVNNVPVTPTPQSADPAYRNRVNNVPVTPTPQRADPAYRNRVNDVPANRAPQNTVPTNRDRYQYDRNQPQRSQSTEPNRVPNNPDRSQRVNDQRQREIAPQRQQPRVETPPVRKEPAKEVERKKEERR